MTVFIQEADIIRNSFQRNWSGSSGKYDKKKVAEFD